MSLAIGNNIGSREENEDNYKIQVFGVEAEYSFQDVTFTEGQVRFVWQASAIRKVNGWETNLEITTCIELVTSKRKPYKCLGAPAL